MFDYDLIIVSKTTEDLKSMVQATIDSCLDTANGKRVNAIVVETSRERPRLDHVNKVVMFNEKFNYNRALNAGLSHRKGLTQMLANNDLVFKEGWSDTGEIMRMNGILSASLPSRKNKSLVDGQALAYEGYKIGFHLAGWLIFTQEALWAKIGQLPENFNFWYSDNDYVDTLIQHNIPHYLLTNGIVEHIGSTTLKTLSNEQKKEYTIKESIRYGKNKRS